MNGKKYCESCVHWKRREEKEGSVLGHCTAPVPVWLLYILDDTQLCKDVEVAGLTDAKHCDLYQWKHQQSLNDLI